MVTTRQQYTNGNISLTTVNSHGVDKEGQQLSHMSHQNSYTPVMSLSNYEMTANRLQLIDTHDNDMQTDDSDDDSEEVDDSDVEIKVNDD